MSRHRYHARELAHFFDGSRQPLYVLDDQLTIVFVNEACREWLGPAADDLVGRRCVYDTPLQPTPPDAVAAALCPPPAVLSGREVAAHVARTTAQGAIYRRAKFIPLGFSADDLVGVVALLDANDCPEPVSEPPSAEQSVENESLVLHEHLRRFHRQTALRHAMDRLIGTSPAMRRARAQAELAVGTRASVLLVGPPGSGRRRVAETIHHGGTPGRAGMLIPLDCSLLGVELMESTLRALVVSSPLDDEAGRGTLLLTDADRLSQEIQGPLAAILSTPEFPLRLMATVEQPLVEWVRHGRYREDLAALLSTITIELPPLAHRREDIPLLAQALLEEINGQRGRQIGGFAPESLDCLDAYVWPGNIDELATVVAQSCKRAAGPLVMPDDLPEQLHLAASAATRPRRKEETIVLDEFLARIERELIRRALARAKGNKAKAARLLGLNRPRLYRRMVQLGLLKEGGEGGE